MMPSILGNLYAIYFFAINHPMLLTASATGVLWARARTINAPNPADAYLICKILFGIGTLTYVILIASYYTSANFIDHVEAQIAALGAAIAQGQDIYHALDGTHAYSIGYGPAIYRVVSLAYTLAGNTITAAKAPTLCANILTITALAITLKHYTTDNNRRLLLGLYITTSLIPFGAVIWLRSDPLLTMCSALSFLAFITKNNWLAHILLGVLIGVSFLLKVHGPIYLIPTVIAFRPRLHWPMTTISLLVLTALLLTTFQFSYTEATAYWNILQINLHHGISLWAIVNNLEFAVYFLTPLGLFWYHSAQASTIRNEHVCNFATLTACYSLIAIIAGKPGAGNWHFLPLVPASVIFLAQALSNTPISIFARKYALILPAWAVTSVFLGVTRHDDWIVRLLRNNAHQEINELSEICKKYKDRKIIMGFGDEADHAGYQATWVRPWLVLHKHPYNFDPVAIMDLQAANYPSTTWQAVTRIKQSALDPLVLIPHNEQPFALRSYYNGQMLTPTAFRDFPSQFFLKESREFYDVWAPSPEKRH